MQTFKLWSSSFFSSFLTLKEQKISTKILLSLIIAAYVFGVGIRLIWAFQNHGVEAFKFNNEFIINSPDGFYFAEGARDILAGGHEANDNSPIDRAMSIVTAILYKVIPFVSFETLIFYMPAVLSSLVVIPIVMIGRELKNPVFGFYTALVCVVSFGFYTRTFAGYYDDDFFSLTLPVFLVYTILLYLRKGESKYLFLLFLTACFYDWWYTNAAIIISSIMVCLAMYIYLFDRKNIFGYKAISIVLIVASQLYLPMQVSVGIAMICWYHYSASMSEKYVYYTLLASFAVFAYFGGMDPLINKWNYYIFKPISNADSGLGLKYFSSLKTVTESQYADFKSIYKYTSGNVYFFWVGFVGFILLLMRYNRLVLLVPIFALGLLSVDGGLRFTAYGSIAFSFGISYIFVLLTQLIAFMPAMFVAQIALLAMYIYPNLNIIKATRITPSMVKDEVSILSNLGKHIGREDYIYSWWDYGYPVKYYANSKVHSDGGGQEGTLTFIESSVLTSSSQIYAANLLRDATEVHELGLQKKIESTGGTFGDVMKYSKYKSIYDPNQMQYYLGAFDYPTQPKTRDVYLMLPYRMLPIYSTVMMFSQRDLKTGKRFKQNLFYYAEQFSEDDSMIKMPEVTFDKKNGLVYIQNKPVKIASFVVISDSMKDSPQVSNISLYQDSNIFLIYMKDYKSFLLCDAEMLSSNFVQMFVFNNYNKDLFEKIDSNPYMKIFKLKK